LHISIAFISYWGLKEEGRRQEEQGSREEGESGEKRNKTNHSPLTTP
jgi:hypothetical protein